MDFFFLVNETRSFSGSLQGSRKLTIGKLWEKMSEMSEESRYNSLPSRLRLAKGSRSETHFDHLYLEPETST